MASFGYEPEPVRLALGQRLGFALRDLPVQSAHLVAWRTRESIRGRTGRRVPAYRLVEREEAA